MQIPNRFIFKGKYPIPQNPFSLNIICIFSI